MYEPGITIDQYRDVAEVLIVGGWDADPDILTVDDLTATINKLTAVRDELAARARSRDPMTNYSPHRHRTPKPIPARTGVAPTLNIERMIEVIRQEASSSRWAEGTAP